MGQSRMRSYCARLITRRSIYVEVEIHGAVCTLAAERFQRSETNHGVRLGIDRIDRQPSRTFLPHAIVCAKAGEIVHIPLTPEHPQRSIGEESADA